MATYSTGELLTVFKTNVIPATTQNTTIYTCPTGAWAKVYIRRVSNPFGSPVVMIRSASDSDIMLERAQPYENYQEDPQIIGPGDIVKLEGADANIDVLILQYQGAT